MYEITLALTVVIFLGTTAFYLRHPAASVFHPVTYYLLFHGIVFAVRPLFAWAYDFHGLYDAIGYQPTTSNKVVALVCANLALLVFTATCLVLARAPVPFRQSVAEVNSRGKLLRAFLPLAIPLGLLGLYGLFDNLQGALTTDISDIRKIDARTGATYLVGSSGYLISLPMLLAPLVAIIAYLGRFRWWSLMPFVVFALFKLSTGGRGHVLTAGLMIVLLHMLDSRRKWPRLALVPVAVLSWMVFDAIGSDRGLALRQAMGYEESVGYVRDRSDEKPLETMDLANMEFLEYLIWAVPNRTGGYEYFVHNLQIFTEPIPRALWPGKPVGPPIQMIELYRYATPLGATSSVAGQGWIAAGYAGVVLWAGLFGVIFGWAYRAFVRSSGGNVASVAYVVFASTAIIIFRDGSVMTILKNVQFYYVPVLALAAASYYLAHSGAANRVSGLAGAPEGASQRRRIRAHAAGGASPTLPNPVGTEPLPSTPRGRRLARMRGLA